MRVLRNDVFEALLALNGALGAFVGHFDNRVRPPVIDEKYRGVQQAMRNLKSTLDADQQ